MTHVPSEAVGWVWSMWWGALILAAYFRLFNAGTR